jgi:formate hydrogenlyase transcriptional activator
VELSTKQVHVDRDYVVAVARDLTERKVAEARLTASETRYRAVHDRAPVGICRVEVGTGRFLGVNPKYCEIVGRTEEDLLGRTFLSITHPDDLMQGQQNLRQVADVRKRHCEIEKRYVRPDGSVRWVELEVVTMGREDAEPDSYLAIVQDITERRQSGESLREYERVVEGLEEMIAVVDRNYRYVIANRAFLEYRGLRKDQVVGRFVSDIIGQAAFVDRVKEKMDECFLGKVVQYQLIYDFPKLGRKELCASYFPIEGRTGVDRLAMIVRDITEQKQAEQARRKAEENLQKSESRLRLALDGSPIKVFNQDRELRYTWVYNLQEGWSEEDYLGKTDEEIFGPENAAKMLAIKRPVLETGRGTRQEFTLKARGKIYYCDITVEPLVDAAGQVVGVNCACVDITQLREIMEELRLAKEKLAEEKLYLEESIDSELGFGEIIGRSSALKVVMQKVAKVAPSDATVLLLGETGTGKELVARALHRLSNRQGNSFIKMNCAAIPSGLLESELFGHEKGAFTGAVARKVGRLELADKGTLFLDEIGEVPLSLQPKLLRVLQDQEFERLGSTQTLKVNFRLLAATNRDLLQSVKAREFRSDLYYRLNVFPIVIPPLRERREDIRPLIEHFVRKFAMQMKKSVASIPSKTMETLVRWEWPGNIRELENFVERSVILTPGSVLQSPLSELEAEIDKVNGPHNDGLRAVERERILRALHDCHGKLGGADGAAARLGLKRTTLQSKLDHLGIKPESYRA